MSLQRRIIDPTLSYFDITFHVLKSNKDRYLACLDKIGKLEADGKLIPVRLYREWSGYIYTQDQILKDAQTKTYKKYNDAANSVIAYFDKQRGYQMRAEGKDGVIFRFEDFIYSMFYLYYLNVLNEDNKKDWITDVQNKQGTLNYFYQSICVNSAYYDTPKKLLFKFYQKVVIASYITQMLGYTCTSKKNFTNKDLFQSSKNSLTGLRYKKENS